MSELKVIDVDKMADVRSLSGQFYRKPEADEVIEYLQNQLSLSRTELLKSLAKAQHEAHHNKYKRCMAMARWCEAFKELNRYGDQDYMDFAEKWHKRWLELAEKFKKEK